MWVNLSTHLRQKEGEVSMTLSYCLPFKSLTLLMPVLCHVSFQRLSNQFHSSPPEVKRVFRNVWQQSDLPDVRINMWRDTMWQHLERRSQRRVEHLNCRFMFSSLWFGPSTSLLKLFHSDVRIWFQTKPSPIDLYSLDQTQNSGQCQELLFYGILCIDVVPVMPSPNALGLVFLKVVFLSMLSHLHYQPALGPTANSYPGPTPAIINSQEILKKSYENLQEWNCAATRHNSKQFSFNTRHGRRSWFRLRHCLCCKKITGARRTSTTATKWYAFQKSLFLTIAQFQQLDFSWNSLTYPNYPYIHKPIQCIYISFYPSLLSQHAPGRRLLHHHVLLGHLHLLPQHRGAPTIPAGSYSHILCTYIYIYIDVHKKCSRIHVACFNCPRGRYIYIWKVYIYIWKVYIQCVYIYIRIFNVSPQESTKSSQT